MVVIFERVEAGVEMLSEYENYVARKLFDEALDSEDVSIEISLEPEEMQDPADSKWKPTGRYEKTLRLRWTV